MIKQNQKYLNYLLILIDMLSIGVALVLAWGIRFKSGFIYVQDAYLSLEEYLIPVLFIMPIYIVIYSFFNLYTPHRIKNSLTEIINILKSNLLGLLILISLLFLSKEIHYSRYLLLIFSICNVFIMIIERAIIRILLRKARTKGYNLKHLLVVGFSDLTVEFLRRVEKNKQWGYQVIGILDDTKKLGYQVKGHKVIGNTYELERILDEKTLDEVIITLPIQEYGKLKWVIGICEKSGVRTLIIPDYYQYIPARPFVEEVDGLPIINIRHVPLDHIIHKGIKRTMDIMGALAALVLFSPVMLLTAAIIKMTSPGPIFFLQERVGLNRKSFKMIKFRSMHVQTKEEERVQWTTKNDPRKTRFGNFIRKTSIDELPQLINVLKGDMSLVGPRPERPYFVEKFKEEIPKYMIKHQVRPGITGWAQVNGWRGDTSIRKRIECDLYYIENWKFSLDIKILILTVVRGFINPNAY